VSRALDRALQVAGGVAVAGGLVLGGAPLPLSSFGCTAAFDGAGSVTDNSIEVVTSCAEQRADRQEVAIAFLVLGLGTVLGAEVHVRARGGSAGGSRRPSAVDLLTPAPVVPDARRDQDA
jgi:hypothetical protein